ncbi:MAG: DUF5658 family protein [Clostridium chrysemydis]|uniref:DUF5658 family protein n=1 Tax=Clostridium chrysemydis TaxID=2665504 RepID=UPI003F30D5E9
MIDIIFTLMLLETDMFMEANTVMQGVVINPIISIILKVGAVGVLVYFVYKRLDQANEKQLKIGNLIVTGMMSIYVIIDIMYIGYLIIYLYLKLILNMV